MQDVVGDLFSQKADAICIPTNCFVKQTGAAVMGAGIAKQLVMRYPGVDFVAGELISLWGDNTCLLTKEEDGNIVVPTRYVQPAPYHIVLFPTKPEKEEVLPGAVNVVDRYANDAVPGTKVPGWQIKSNLTMIRSSATQLVDLTTAMGWTKVCLPTVGCGNGELKWQDVEAELSPILDARFVIVHRPRF